MKTQVSWRAPGRVNLIGEHTDYNDGFVLPLAIGQGCDATVSLLDDPVIEVVSAQRESPVEVALADLEPDRLPADDAWAGYALGVVWALTQRGAEIPGLSISLDTDLPEGAGLSSSAALGCSVTAAVNDLCDLRLDRAELVRIARQAENEFVGAPTGGMDQLASIYGEDGHALLADMRSLKVETLPLDLAAAGLSLLVTNSRISHPLADNEYRDRRASCELAARLLGVATLRELTLDDLSESLDRLDSDLLKKRVRHVVTENDRALACADLLRTGQLRQVGPLLTASHMSLRDDFDSSVPEVDLAVEVMLAFGAYGARITGRGFGGCAIALMDIAQARAAVIGLDGAFAGRGYLQPRSFTVAASSGAHALSA